MAWGFASRFVDHAGFKLWINFSNGYAARCEAAAPPRREEAFELRGYAPPGHSPKSTLGSDGRA